METERDTAWEEKTRARYKEGAESHRLRELAANPETPAYKLEAIGKKALRRFNSRSDITTDACLIVLEAVAANPNTPPFLLPELIEQSPFSCRAFCRNPITPLLLLEKPDFVTVLTEQAQHALLREADAPLLFIQMLANGNAAQNEAVRQAARLHVAFAGEAKSPDEWEPPVREYWRNECAALPGDQWGDKTRQWHADLAEMGLVPPWAAGVPPVPELISLDSLPVLDEWFQFAHTPGSVQEEELLKRIGPDVEDFSVLARGLRRDATPADLQQLLCTSGRDTGLVHLAILHHPAVNADLVAQIAGVQGERYQQVIVRHPQTPASVLAHLLQSEAPHLRRLARKHKNAPPDAVEISRQVFLRPASQFSGWPSPFASFAACLHGLYQPTNVPQKAQHHHWAERLGAVLLAFPTDDPLPDDPEKRTGRDLLHHLTKDGSRIVRAAAKTRLADPAYRFSLTAPGDEAIPLV